MAKELQIAKLPITVTLENVGTEDVGFRYFRVNFTEVLAPEDKVVISAVTSEEAAYYNALADEKVGLKVTVAEAEE